MEMRLVIALVLMGAVLFITPYFVQTPPEEAKTVSKTAVAPEKTPSAPATPKPSESTPQVSAAPASGSEVAAVAAQEEQVLAPIETDLYRIEFTNRGALIKSWILKEYKDANGHPLDLVSPVGKEKVGYPFAIQLKGSAELPEINQALFVATPVDGGYDFEYSDGKTYAKKTFRVKQGSYLVNASSQFTQNGTPTKHLLAWRGGFGDHTGFAAADTIHSIVFDTAENKLIVNDADYAKGGPQTRSGSFAFAGLEDKYFAIVNLPSGTGATELYTINDQLPDAEGKQRPIVGGAIGGEAQNRLMLFVGPKDYNLLKSIDPRLEKLIDFGWSSFIAKPLFLALKYVNDTWVFNWGWSIIIVTVIINILLLPLKITSLKSMRKMSLIAPDMKAINDKYKGLSMKDPKMQKKNEEVMALYKKHGVNPAGGCLPLLLQFPFLFAFYAVLQVAIELRQENWLWVTDLSQPETIAIRILPLVMIASQFLMQKMTPATGGDPAQQKIMLFMPLVFGFMFYNFPSGLVLYWLTGNLVGIAQQWVFNKTMPAPAVAEIIPPKRKNS